MLIDPFGRKIEYLRLALTDRCNLRCQYCMPEEGILLKERAELLTFEEVERLLTLFSQLGIRKLRLTGGEPLVRNGISALWRFLHNQRLFHSINITTNGILLKKQWNELRSLAINSINISIDSLNPKKYAKITRRDTFFKAWEAISMVEKTPIELKLNMVVIKGENEDEIPAFINLAKTRNLDVRFLEKMPFDGRGKAENFISATDIILKIIQCAPELKEQVPENTARLFSAPSYKGRVGVIAGNTRSFCGSCNRLRLTPDGLLKTCLYSAKGLDIKKLMRSGYDDETLIKEIKLAINKKEKNGFEAEQATKQYKPLSMAQIGG